MTSLAGVAPAAGDAARAFLAATYSPLANAAWQYDTSFGWTNVPVELMQDYVSAQTYAMRSAGNSRFGFAWSPMQRSVPRARPRRMQQGPARAAERTTAKCATSTPGSAIGETPDAASTTP